MRAKVIIAVIVLLIAGSLFAYSSQKSSPKITPTPAPKKLTKVKIGIIPTASLLQYFVAKEKGYFIEEGLDVEAITMKGGTTIAPAVASGSIDIGFSSTGPIISAYLKGFDFKYIVGGSFKKVKGPDFQQMLVNKDSGIENPKDMEGKRLGSPTIGGTSLLIIKSWAKKNKVNADKITLVEVPVDTMGQALTNKLIDGALLNEPYLSKAFETGSVRVLDNDPIGAIGAEILISSWFSKKTWIEKNTVIVASFARALEKATKDIKSSSSKQMSATIARYTKMDIALAEKMILPDFETSLKASDLQPMIDQSAEFGITEKSFPAQEIVSFKLSN